MVEQRIEGEDEKTFKVRRDMEIRYQAELQPVHGMEGSLVSRNYVIPHLLIFNIDPQDYERIVSFTKRKASGKMFRALTMLLDLADAIEYAGSKPEPVPANPEKGELSKKVVTRVLGGKSYEWEVKE